MDRHRAALRARAAAPGDDRHAVGGGDPQRGGDVLLAARHGDDVRAPERRARGARGDRRPVRVGGVGVKLCVVGVDRVRSEDRGERGRKLDQLRNRRLHLLTTELALAFNCCQGHVHDSSKPVTHGDRHRRRHLRGEGHRGRGGRRGARAPRSAVPAVDAHSRAGRNRIPTTGGKRLRRRSTGSPTASPASASPARCTASSRSTPPTGRSAPRSSGTTSGPPRSARRSRRRVGFDRLVELTGNRALTGFTAPKLLWLRKHEPDNYARIAHVMLPKDYVRLQAHRRAGDRRRRRVRHAAARRRAAALERRGALDVLEIDPAWLPTRARVAGGLRPDSGRRRGRRRARATRRRAGSASASTGRGRCRSRWARPASSSPRCRSTAPTRRPASTPSATPCPAPGTRWA